MEGWQSDKVGLGFVATRWVQGQQRMADLLDMNGSTKTRLLTIVALQLYSVLLVRDAISCHGRVVGDLLRYHFCSTNIATLIPVAKKEFAQKRIEGFLFIAKFLGSRTVLLMEGID